MEVRRSLAGGSWRAMPGIAALAVGLGAGPLRAQVVEWQGSAFLSGYSEACIARGWSGTQRFDATFLPAFLGTNGPSSTLSFFDRTIAISVMLPRGRFDGERRQVEGAAIGNRFWTWRGEVWLWLTQQVPARIGLRTRAVRLAGVIENFDGIEGCLATFDVVAQRRPG